MCHVEPGALYGPQFINFRSRFPRSNSRHVLLTELVHPLPNLFNRQRGDVGRKIHLLSGRLHYIYVSEQGKEDRYFGEGTSRYNPRIVFELQLIQRRWFKCSPSIHPSTRSKNWDRRNSFGPLSTSSSASREEIRSSVPL